MWADGAGYGMHKGTESYGAIVGLFRGFDFKVRVGVGVIGGCLLLGWGKGGCWDCGMVKGCWVMRKPVFCWRHGLALMLCFPDRPAKLFIF